MVISQILEIFLLAAILFFDVIFGDFPVGKNCPTFDILLSTSISTKNHHKTFFAIVWGLGGILTRLKRVFLQKENKSTKEPQ